MKEIETKVIAYEADDGTIFDTAKKCESYELRKRINEIKKFDRDFNPTSYNNCHYLVIRNNEDVKILKAYCEAFGMCSPWDEEISVAEDFYGILVYEDSDWYSLDEQIANLINQRDRILELCSH